MGIGLVLVYHRIASISPDPWGLCVTPKYFDEHLEIIRKRTRPMQLAAFVESAASKTIQPRSVVVTFDDGYSDNLLAATPLLERHDVPAAAFLSTGYIEEAHEFWWDELERILLGPIVLPEELEIKLNGVTRRWQIDNTPNHKSVRVTPHANWRAGMKPPTLRHKAFVEVWALLRQLDHPGRAAVLEHLRQWTGLDRVCRRTHRPLTPEEVSELGSHPLLEIGAHTESHSALSALPGERQRQEINNSRHWLESQLGVQVRSFAYPFGQATDYTDETVAILREEGFSCACTTAANVVSPDSDRFQLPRFHVGNLDGGEFERQLDAWLGDGSGHRGANRLAAKKTVLEIDRVALDDPTGQLLGANIDLPTANVLVPDDIEIVGWVLGRAAVADAVELVHNDEVVQREPVDAYRPDVGAAFPAVGDSTWAGFRFVLDASPEMAQIDLWAVLENEQRVRLTTIRRGLGLRRNDGEALDKLTVAVVIPCYNQAHYLPEAIESVLAQTHHRIEVVVVDDGSIDNTSEVAARYPGVHCVRQENKGLAGARNRGLQSTSAPYVMFLDADDRFLPDAVRTSLDLLESHPEWAFVSGNHQVVAADGTLLDVSDEGCFERPGFLQLLHRNYIVMHGTVMYRRGAIEREQGFDVSLRACEDYDLYLRIARNAKVGCHDKVIAEYRQHSGNMTQTSGRMLKSAISVLNSQWQHVKSRDHRKALHGGLQFYRNHFGGRLLDDMRFEFHEGDWGQAARDLVAIVRYYPRGLTSLTIAPLKKRVGLTPVGIRALAILRTLRRPHFSQGAPNQSGPQGLPRQLTPVSECWGFDRGVPIDRYYIESFLEKHRNDVRGRVLETGDNSYTDRFGGERVEQSDVLNRETDSPGTTIVGDLAGADHVPSESFDCVILTQTLHLIYETEAALRTLHRILAPGGVLLLTVPGITRISQNEWPGSWFWSFTSSSIQRLFEEVFAGDLVEVEAHGNVLTASAFLYGMATEELTKEELDHRDPNYEVTVAVRACKARHD